MNRIIAIAVLSLALLTACSRTNQPSNTANQIPTLTGGEGVAGSFGEPPGAVRTLIAPIELVSANGYSDGGTTWVSLKDSNGTRAIFCVTQDAFESDIPHNALYVGGTHAEEPSSRLPVSKNEALMLVQALRLALNDVENALTSGNATEQNVRDALEITKENQRDPRTWQIRFARQALRKLANRTDFPLADLNELDARIAKLTSVDLDALAKTFRETSAEDRAETWTTLKPCLSGKLNRERQPDIKAYLIELLGEPDASAIKACSGMMGFDAAVEDRVIAYLIKRDGLYSNYLAIDLRNPAGLNFRQIASYGKREE